VVRSAVESVVRGEDASILVLGDGTAALQVALGRTLANAWDTGSRRPSVVSFSEGGGGDRRRSIGERPGAAVADSETLVHAAVTELMHALPSATIQFRALEICATIAREIGGGNG
jgi:hypothetical protein